MFKLLMVSGDRGLAQGKRGAFYNTLEEFHKYWQRIDIICPHVDAMTESPLFGNIFLHPSPWPLWLQSFWINKKGQEIYKEQAFDLITTHEYPPFYNGFGVRLLTSHVEVPYIMEIMHIPGHPKAGGVKEAIYKKLVAWYIARDVASARAIRVINRKETPDFLINAGVPKDKLFYAHAMYIDLSTFKVMPEIVKTFDIVYAARLEKNKGIANLVEAIGLARQSRPDIKLLIIGNGSLKSELEAYIASHDLNKNITFSGWLETLDDVASAYNSARILVNPSFNEGGPRVVLEAMACGLSVITTRVGMMHDIIKEGQNGLFIDWDARSIAETLLDLLKDKERQNKFREAGLELVKQFERKAAIKNYALELQKFV